MGSRKHRPRWITAATVLGALTIAACGSSGPGSTATTGKSAYALSDCMRSNGVSDFPDPSAGPSGAIGLSVSGNPGSDTLTVAGTVFSGPAFDRAEQACKAYLPGAGGPAPPISASQRAKDLAFAKCMRAHGVPNFPDPQLSGGATGQKTLPIDANAPAVQRAARACGSP